MKIITISGLDGSGKTTQVELLIKSLDSKGMRTFYFHATQFSLPNKLRKKFTDPNSNSDSGVTNASRGSILLRKVFLTIDLLRFRLLMNRLERKGYNAIISDRYFYDTVVNIEYLQSKKYRPRVLPVKPDVSFFMDISPEAIMKRERAPIQGVQYLNEKNKLYRNSPFFEQMVKLNANSPQLSISKKVLATIDKSL